VVLKEDCSLLCHTLVGERCTGCDGLEWAEGVDLESIHL
jgi:hypothetical protein